MASTAAVLTAPTDTPAPGLDTRRAGIPPGLRALTKLTAASTLFLIFAGGMVTSTDSGLAVPDWPLSYGMLMPPMVGGIFYEHGHRMVASAVGLLTLIQAIWIWRVDERRPVRRLALAALAAVVTQGLLGGLTVLFLLPTAVSVSHACLAQAFLCLAITLAFLTSARWERRPLEVSLPDAALGLPLLTAGVIYMQLILGALMRHLGVGLAIPDFPLAHGSLIPPFDLPGVPIHFAHRAWAVVVVGAVLTCGLRLRRLPGSSRALRLLGSMAILTVLTQATLGAATVLTGKQPHVTSLHVVTGAFLLGVLVVATLEVLRLGPRWRRELALPPG